MRRSEYQQPGVILETRTDAAAEMARVLATVPGQLNALSDADSSETRVAGKWSPKHILGHLIDSASNNHQRFVRAQIQKSLDMPGYTQAEWVSTQHYELRAWSDLVALWTAYNRHMLHIMEVTPEENLGIECVIGGDVSGTLEFLMVDYVAHMEHHLNQILTPQ